MKKFGVILKNTVRRQLRWIINVKDAKHFTIVKIHYTSADEAWENYKAEYFTDYPELAEGFKDDNPLANSSQHPTGNNKSANIKNYIHLLCLIYYTIPLAEIPNHITHSLPYCLQ